MSQIRNSAGISLLEVLVSMVLLALIMLGLASVYVAGRGYMVHNRARTSAGELATVFLEPLQNFVRQSDWDNSGSNNLSVNTYSNATTVNGILYNSSFVMTNDPAGTTLRRVKVNITWNETKF
jgi:Tfp pilus assembly protein PilV